jgi:uncharacterized protein with NAD-binding domain and iron-sulfur cluster
MTSKGVLILGGGVAGLTAAHELVQRGFHVTIWDCRAQLGGKARSFSHEVHEVHAGRHYLQTVHRVEAPAEHGFRFFPGFYRHLDDTMARIPSAPNDGGRHTVKDCLVPITEERLAVSGRPHIDVPASLPRKVTDLRNALRFPDRLLDLGLTRDDLATFANKLWQIATSCKERRHREYEQIAWRDFIESKDRSSEYYWYLASGLTRTLVAARAKTASTKTMGNVALRLSSDFYTGTSDRVLCGPTNDVWIAPWLAHIRRLADDRRTQFFVENAVKVERLHVEGDRITAIDVSRAGRVKTERVPDYVVSALPVDALARVLESSPERLVRADNQLPNIQRLAEYLVPMTGIQIYLREDERFNRGHQLHLDSPWGLTSISQRQFWASDLHAKDPPGFLPNEIEGILSVDISSWTTPDKNGVTAAEAYAEGRPKGLAVFEGVLEQLRSALGRDALKETNVLGYNMETEQELILVNGVGTWELRPESTTKIRNFLLAGDFVRTETDLACMEGANESARLAVNAILEAERRTADRCAHWGASEPAILAPLQELDRLRFLRGLPWSGVDIGRFATNGADILTAATEIVAGAPKEKPVEWGFEPYRLPRQKWDDAAPELPVKALTRDERDALLPRTAQPGREDPMFRRWRLYTMARPPASIGHEGERPNVLVPFQVFDADALIVYGYARNVEYLDDLCRRASTDKVKYYPVCADKEGRRVGFAELWVIDYSDTSGGPYRELVINFVVSKGKRRPNRRWQTPYSALIPMMDPDCRLLTPRLILEEREVEKRAQGTIGPIEYGNALLGTDKRRGKITMNRTETKFSFEYKDGSVTQVEGGFNLLTTVVDAAVVNMAIARELGPVQAYKNWRQSVENAEMSGGLIAKNFVTDSPTVEIQSAYKFSPRLSVLRQDAGDRLRYYTEGDPRAKDPSLGSILTGMGFQEVVAAHDPHLRSVLYRDGWPTPQDS